MFTVTATIQSTIRTSEPVVIRYYRGDDLARALAAAATAATTYDTQYTEILSVTIDMGVTPNRI